MQSSNLNTDQNCEQFFAAFDQIKIDNNAPRDTGLTVFQVEKLLGPPSTVSAGVGHNLYTYNVGRCVADVEFANGRTVRKTFAIVGTPASQQADRPLAKPQPNYVLWAIAMIAVISVMTLVWYILRNPRPPDEIEPERQLVTPQDFRPDEPLPISTDAGQSLKPHGPARQQQQPKKDPRPWHEAS